MANDSLRLKHCYEYYIVSLAETWSRLKNWNFFLHFLQTLQSRDLSRIRIKLDHCNMKDRNKKSEVN